MARECLRSTRLQLGASLPSRAVSEAYYAMLYAARAALSEEDDYAKTHRGVWGQFGRRFVQTGRFDGELAAASSRLEEMRLGTDYDARRVPQDEAEEIAATAERFVSGVVEMLEDEPPA